VERSLREGREGADRLDLVPEEVDPDRLAAGGGEDVHEAAANGEPTALVRLLDALVAGERERLRHLLEPEPGAHSQTQRLRARRRRRHAFGERRRGRAHEPAGGQDVERPGPLADQVRRRLEAGVPAHASARQQRDPFLAQEPGRGLGDVACVAVLGRHEHERTAEVLVQRRDDERQPRLGDAGALRQRIGERLQALVLDELGDERVQCRAVHDESRNARFRAGGF
jgi:hypothetical protein